jgi:hypothetical protein
MSLEFAYGLDGASSSSIKDFPLDTQGTASTGYNVGISGLTAPGAYYAKKGDVVFLTAGKLQKTYNVASPKAVGVVEGFEFTGLVPQGTLQPGASYAAANVYPFSSAQDTTKYPNGLAKVRIETDSVYRAPVKAGQTVTNAMIGGSYNISIDAATGDQSVDTSLSTNVVFKVVDTDTRNNKLFVIMASNNTF